MTRALPCLLLAVAPLATSAAPSLSYELTSGDNPTSTTPQPAAGIVTGKVTLADGQPAEGVSVLLKGSSVGTTVEADGTFRLRVPAGPQTLAITFMGYVTQEIAVDVAAKGTTTLPAVTLQRDAQQLSEVRVTGVRSLNQQATSIGKMPVRPMDLPQSIVTINQPVLEQQQTLRISDVLANVSGVYIMGTTGGTQEEIASRGFALGSNNTFKNGVRFNNGVQPEVSALESFEVLKGSNAILFGNVAAGGVINLVTKKPKFESGGSLGFRVGSFDFYKPMVDVYGAVNGSEHVAFRLNGTYENARSFRQGVSSERFYANPSLLFKIGQKTDLLVEGDYLRDSRTPDYGIGAINYEIPDVPRGRFLGARWAYNNTTQRTGTVTLTHRLTDSWQVRGTAAYQGYDNDLLSTARPNASSQSIKPNGDWNRTTQRSGTLQDYFLGQLDLTGKFRTFFLDHALLVGVEADKYKTTTLAYTGGAYDIINVFDPAKYTPKTNTPDLPLASRTHAPVSRVGAYVQDLISVGEHVKVLAGVRYSYLDTRSKALTYSNNVVAPADPRFDKAFSPRLGVVYQPVKTTSIFASYATSFVPNAAPNVSATNRPLLPSTFQQTEVGVKNDLFNGLLSANLTAYRIVNSNLAQTYTGPVLDTNGQPVLDANGQTTPNSNSNVKELAGEVTSKGIELDVQTRSYRGWTMIAGYSYNRTTYTKSNIYRVGDLLRYNPNHTANLSLFYTLEQGALKGLQAGVLAYYVGERQAGRNNRQTVQNDAFKLIALPAYTQFDASLGYTWQRLSLRVKAANLLNQLSYNVHDDNSVNPIAPRNYSATLSYKL